MRLTTKWLLTSIVGTVGITSGLLLFPTLILDVSPTSVAIARVAFWPVTVCEYVVGPGPSIGPPEKHLHEGTPIQFLAAVVGVALSWIFYSGVVFVFMRWRHRAPAR